MRFVENDLDPAIVTRVTNERTFWRDAMSTGRAVSEEKERVTMSLWLDMLGAEIRFVDTRSFGRTRIAEAGRGQPETLVFLHGIGGHPAAHAQNHTSLADRFHPLAH